MSFLVVFCRVNTLLQKANWKILRFGFWKHLILAEDMDVILNYVLHFSKHIISSPSLSVAISFVKDKGKDQRQIKDKGKVRIFNLFNLNFRF